MNWKTPARVAVSTATFLAVWEGAARSGYTPITLFPPPTRVLGALVEMAQSGELTRDLAASLRRAAAGFLVGSSAGVGVGLATGRIAWIDHYFSPIIHIFRPIPPVAAIPIVITWMGITEASKVFSIAFAVFLTVWISAHLGARNIPRTYLWAARTLKIRGVHLLHRVIFPGALPFIVAGCRAGIAIAFVMVYVSELAGASSGIGYQINISHLAYRIDRMLAALVVLGACGALADLLLATGLSLAFPWLRFAEHR
jgi:ABC-type nitrate/sulfonate/bicarbonate transport system permease component